MSTNVFSNLEEKEALRRIRIFFLSCCICSMLFYFLMTSLNPANLDYLPGRITISVFSFACFVCTFFIKKNLINWSRFLLRVTTISFILFYLYLLGINNWSLLYCWSYFVVAAIICSTSMTWDAYKQHALIGVGGPLILGLWSPMNHLELFHFHSANIATFGIIGVAVHSSFKYRNEITKLTNDYIEQSKMAALGEMAGGISHEINNPLAIIKGSVEQLKRVAPENTKSKEKFDNLNDKISRMVDRITTITAGLREFSQDNSNQPLELHDLNELVKTGIQHSLRKFNDVESEIIFSSSEEPAMYLCKKNQIVQIVLNLCTNAIEATQNNSNTHIEVTLKKEKNLFVIAILDNGMGVPVENARKIMEPFFTTKEIGSGLGLGLSAAHGFAKVHGGQLTLESSKELTRFNLRLPISHQNVIQ